MRAFSLVGLGLALAAVSACAPMESGGGPTAAGSARACFLPSTVVNFRSDGDAVTYIRAGRNEVYELRASGFCRGLSSANSIGVSGPAGGGSTPCVGDYVDLAVRGPGLQNENNSQCRAQVSRRLTAEEVAALPNRMRP